ncbi:MAG TPA: PP2C family protein-serine/threonine phosphatase [Luteitalea sp.]|nr:PP2C family protein-serine/threonine phosphatase [Luteitalea sp.]
MIAGATRLLGALALLATIAGGAGQAVAQTLAPAVVDIPVATVTFPGMALDRAGWRYAPGDDLRWSDPAFDDAAWTRIESTWRAPGSTAFAWKGTGWFRLRVRLPASTPSEPIALQLTHFSASEIYVDGVRAGGFGRVGSTPEDEATREPRGRAVALPLVPGQVHLIAVRVSSWPLADGTRSGRWFTTAGFPAGFRSRLLEANVQADTIDREHARNVALLTALTAVFTTFGLLHLLYFWLRRTDTDNLWFATYALSLALLVGSELQRDLVDHSLWAGAVMYFRGYVLLSLMAFSLVAFVFSTTRRALPLTALLVLASEGVLSATALLHPLQVFEQVHGALQFVQVLLALLGAAGALRERLPSARLVGVAAVAGALPLALTALESLGVEVASRSLLIFVGLATVVAVASAAQAWRFARTSERLREQLDRVQELSARERERDLAEAAVRAERERERAEAERQAHELEEARAFQLSLLPSRLPDLVGWEAVASMQTASEVGGDYFDVRRMPDGIATLVIGDATGHGLRAGTLVATTKGLFQAVGDHDDLGVALQVMGAALRDLRLRGLFMALTIVRVHPDGRADLASAGMPPALLLDRDGQVTPIGETAPPLGAPIRFGYSTRSLHLRPGDRLVLMTDGVPERLDASDELYGYARVPPLAAAHRHHDGADYIRAIEADLDAFAGRPPADDATLLVVTRS